MVYSNLSSVWGPAWIDIHCKSIWLRARSHMTSRYTWESVTTLHGFGGVVGQPLDTFFWVLTISWSQLLAHVWSSPKGPWPMHFKHSHWWKRRSWSKFTSHYGWGTNKVRGCKMDVSWDCLWTLILEVSWDGLRTLFLGMHKINYCFILFFQPTWDFGLN